MVGESTKVPTSSRVYQFHSGYATCGGINLTYEIETRMGEQGKVLIDAFRSLLTPGKMQTLRIHLLNCKPETKHKATTSFSKKMKAVTNPEDDMTVYCEERLPAMPSLLAIWEMLPGGDGHLLKSLFDLEYATFRTRRNEIYIAPNNMFDRLKQISCPTPNPMTPGSIENTFSDIDDAAIQFSQHSHVVSREERLQLQYFSAAQHKGLIYGTEMLLFWPSNSLPSESWRTPSTNSTFTSLPTLRLRSSTELAWLAGTLKFEGPWHP